MIPIQYNLFIEQGASFTYSLSIEDSYKNPIDLTGAIIISKMASDYDSKNIYNFTTSIIDAVNGKIIISMTADQTAQIPYGRYFYDLIYSISSITNKALYGTVIVNQSISILS